MISEEYTYIYMENTRQGFGMHFLMLQLHDGVPLHRISMKFLMETLGATPFWADQITEDGYDGKDELAKKAAERVIVVR